MLDRAFSFLPFTLKLKKSYYNIMLTSDALQKRKPSPPFPPPPTQASHCSAGAAAFADLKNFPVIRNKQQLAQT